MGYNGYTAKKKASNKRYMDKLTRIAVWVYPEEKEEIQRRAREQNISVTELVKKALNLNKQEDENM